MERTEIAAATHGAPHHLDELVAAALLTVWAREHDKALRVCFLRRPSIDRFANRFDVLLDIGFEYDPRRGRFDHHQQGPALGRCAASLLFDTLFADDPRAEYLRPLIDQVEAVDNARLPPDGETEATARANSLTTLSTLIRATGGVTYRPAGSRRCLAVIQPLVDYWFEQARCHLHAQAELAAARPVGDGVLLDSDEYYGPAMQEQLRATDRRFVGLPGGPGRYMLVAVRELIGRDRVTFPAQLPDAMFIHASGFLAVFPTQAAARTAAAQSATWPDPRQAD